MAKGTAREDDYIHHVVVYKDNSKLTEEECTCSYILWEASFSMIKLSTCLNTSGYTARIHIKYYKHFTQS